MSDEIRRGRGRPRLPDHERRRSYGIPIAGALIDELRTLAEATGKSQGDLTEDALRAEFRRLRAGAVYDLMIRQTGVASDAVLSRPVAPRSYASWRLPDYPRFAAVLILSDLRMSVERRWDHEPNGQGKRVTYSPDDDGFAAASRAIAAFLSVGLDD
jgi:hypothetical protein